MQSAWSLFLHCAGGRANYMLRVVRPEQSRHFGCYSRHKSYGSGHCHDAFVSWRDGSPKRCSNESCGILGKLGRLLFHGPRTTSRDCPRRFSARWEIPWLLPCCWQHKRLKANWLELQGLTHSIRKPLRMASVHHTVTQRTLSPRIFVTGDKKFLLEWNPSAENSSCPSWRTVNSRCCNLQADLWQGCHCRPLHRRIKQSWLLSLSLHVSVVVPLFGGAKLDIGASFALRRVPSSTHDVECMCAVREEPST